MTRISVDNGATFCSVSEALSQVTLERLVPFMDDELCERVNHELAPCTDAEFLTRYLELTSDDFIFG